MVCTRVCVFFRSLVSVVCFVVYRMPCTGVFAFRFVGLLRWRMARLVEYPMSAYVRVSAMWVLSPVRGQAHVMFGGTPYIMVNVFVGCWSLGVPYNRVCKVSYRGWFYRIVASSSWRMVFRVLWYMSYTRVCGLSIIGV